MINLPTYNPCEEKISYLKKLLLQQLQINKKIIIKYDKTQFITNLKSVDICTTVYIENALMSFNDKELLTIKAGTDFFVEGILRCPEIRSSYLGDIYLDSILKRMFSQLEFGYYETTDISDESLEICECIFKSIYSKSPKIKLTNIKKALELFNELQKQSALNKSMINGIIYAVYHYHNISNK